MKERLKMVYILAQQAAYLFAISPRIVQGVGINYKELDLRIHLSNCSQTLSLLKYHTGFNFKTLIDLIIYDIPGRVKRFSVLYVLASVCYNSRLAIRTQTNESLPPISVIRIFQNANWLEREAWDMFGIFFAHHFDLRRILTDYGFSGHPLRKDFPLTGYFEVWFSIYGARVLRLPVSLVQEFRFFNLLNFGFEHTSGWTTPDE